MNTLRALALTLAASAALPSLPAADFQWSTVPPQQAGFNDVKLKEVVQDLAAQDGEDVGGREVALLADPAAGGGHLEAQQVLEVELGEIAVGGLDRGAGGGGLPGV